MSIRRDDQRAQTSGTSRTSAPSALDPSDSPGAPDPADAPDALHATAPIDALDTVDAPDSFDAILKRVVQSPEAGSVLAPGTELVGRFQVARVLGTGGMGTVYVARDTTLGREVAIKVHHAPSGAQRLRREAVAMARLAHPNVVTVFEVGELDGRRSS